MRKSQVASKFKAKFVFKLSGRTYKCMNFLETGKNEYTSSDSTSEACDFEQKQNYATSKIIPVGDCCYEKAKTYHHLNHFMYHTYVKLRKQFEKTVRVADFMRFVKSEKVVQSYKEELLNLIKPSKK